MSYIRPHEGKKYSDNDEPLYAFLSGPHDNIEDYDGPEYFIEAYGDLSHPEHFVEVACRIMERANVSLTLEEVNKLRKELQLEEINKIKSDKELREEYT